MMRASMARRIGASGPHQRPLLGSSRLLADLVPLPLSLSPYLSLSDLPLPALMDARSNRALGPCGRKPLLRVPPMATPTRACPVTVA
jgi:hypothetical protein